MSAPAAEGDLELRALPGFETRRAGDAAVISIDPTHVPLFARQGGGRSIG